MSKRVPLLWLMPLMTCVYAALASAYPYYAMWDSSQVYTLDALLTGAGQLPDHFFHPNMVPLVLYRYLFLPVGVLCGWISVSSITGLQALPNPYLPFAETTIYLIRIGYLFALVFLSFTYLTIFRLLAPQLNAVRGHASWYLALTLTALALVWQYVPFMLIWVRYETIGLALWSIALYATVCAAEAPQRWRGVLLAGFCSGAAVLCKVQLAGGVAMLPFLYVFAQSKAPTLPSVKVRRICTALAIAVAALLALTHGFAYVAFTRHELQRVAFDKFLLAEHFVPIAPSLALLLCGAVAYLLRTAPRHPALAAGAARLSVFAAAFCSVLLLALLIGRTWNERASALCWTYIYSFMLGQLSIGPATGYYRPIDWGAHLPLFVLCAVALAVISFGYLRARERLPRQKLVAGTMAVLIAVLGSTVLLRPDMRKDGLMLGAWLLLASLIVWRLLLALFSPRKMLLLGSVVVWLTVAYQVVGLALAGHLLRQWQRGLLD